MRYNNVFYDIVFFRRNEVVFRLRKEFIFRFISRVLVIFNYMYDIVDSYNFNNFLLISK